MAYEISQRFFFDAAHTLKREVERESSLRIHSHTYNAEVMLSGISAVRIWRESVGDSCTLRA